MKVAEQMTAEVASFVLTSLNMVAHQGRKRDVASKGIVCTLKVFLYTKKKFLSMCSFSLCFQYYNI